MIARKGYDPAAQGALAGLRVVDLSRLVAGNVLTRVLADHGAGVDDGVGADHDAGAELRHAVRLDGPRERRPLHRLQADDRGMVGARTVGELKPSIGVFGEITHQASASSRGMNGSRGSR